MSQSNAVAKRPPAREVAVLLDKDETRAMITPFLRGESYEQVMSEVRIAISKNAEIAQCTPASIVTAVAEAVATGGIIGKDVHLVPFNTNVAPKGQPKQWEKRLQAITDYKHEARLIVGTGAAAAIDAYPVFANEVFEYEAGTEPRIRHLPILDEKARGDLIAFYAVARIRFGHHKVHVMPIEEIDRIRQKFSKSWKDGTVPIWYGKKTCIRQIAKLLPSNPKLAALLSRFRTEEEHAEAVLDDGPIATIEPHALPQLPPRGTAGGAQQAFGGYGDEPMPDATRVIPGQAADGEPIYEAEDASHDSRDPDQLGLGEEG